MRSKENQPVYESSWWYYLNQPAWVLAVRPHGPSNRPNSDESNRGQVSVPGVFARLPVIRLTTIGHKSGKERTVPLFGFREGEQWFVIASNYGSDEHPAWYGNLKANPEVKLTHEDRTKPYLARDATPEEWEEYWNRATDVHSISCFWIKLCQ